VRSVERRGHRRLDPSYRPMTRTSPSSHTCSSTPPAGRYRAVGRDATPQPPAQSRPRSSNGAGRSATGRHLRTDLGVGRPDVGSR
jgi:hypothetical protein